MTWRSIKNIVNDPQLVSRIAVIINVTWLVMPVEDMEATVSEDCGSGFANTMH